jgi:hypothetical protein
VRIHPEFIAVFHHVPKLNRVARICALREERASEIEARE